uniref:Uncharacterized protein n=1 Tax=Lactuca sativa TaxID=4236 RepID=A0A9R1WKY8_LACSA|nr:hypothetical protein LSAT_V11C100024590 [Lactuca sativa]
MKRLSIVLRLKEKAMVFQLDGLECDVLQASGIYDTCHHRPAGLAVANSSGAVFKTIPIIVYQKCYMMGYELTLSDDLKSGRLKLRNIKSRALGEHVKTWMILRTVFGVKI